MRCTLEPLVPDATTVRLLHAWVSHPRSVFWQMGGAGVDEVAREYERISESADHHAWLGRVDGEPTFLAETYDPARSELADLDEVRPGDLGMHLLVAPPGGTPRPGLTRAVFGAVLRHCFADTRVRRVVVEPDVGNEAVLRLNARAGFTRVRDVDLGHKTAALSFLAREDHVLRDPVPHLGPGHLERAQRRLVAKAVSELCHERLLQPEPDHAAGPGRWLLRAPSGATYAFAARRLPLEHWAVDAATLTRTVDGAPAPLDVQELVVEHAEALGLRAELVGVYLEELAATLAWTCWQEAHPGPGVEQLLTATHGEVEAAMTEGHPGFVANRGRIGFGPLDHERYSPDAAAPVRLVWLGARRACTHLALADDLHEDQLYDAALGADRDLLHARLRARGLDPDDYLLLPVHPWQWERQVAVTFAPDLARHDLVWLGEGTREHQALQSIRTFADREDPARPHVKTALAIQNMGFVRGLSPDYMRPTPAISDWVAGVVAGDPELGRCRFTVLREVGALGYTGDVYHAAAPGAPQRRMLAALWRESPLLRLAPGERVVTMASMLHRDPAGASYVAALVRASGLDPRAWLRAFLDAYLRPVVHCLLAHDLAFMPHGENVLVVLEGQAPTRCIMKDLGEEVALLDAERPLPEGLERVRAVVGHDERCLAVLTDVVDGVLRHLAAIWDHDGLLPVADFWSETADCLERHAADHPELAEAVAAYDLQREEFAHSCLNRLQLRDARQMVDLADQASSLLYAGSLRNPLHRGEGAG